MSSGRLSKSFTLGFLEKASTRPDTHPAATAANFRAFPLFQTDYAGTVVNGVLNPYTEGFSADNVVAVGGKIIPVIDLAAVPGAILAEDGDTLTTEAGDPITEET